MNASRWSLATVTLPCNLHSAGLDLGRPALGRRIDYPRLRHTSRGAVQLSQRPGLLPRVGDLASIRRLLLLLPLVRSIERLLTLDTGRLSGDAGGVAVSQLNRPGGNDPLRAAPRLTTELARR